MRTPVKPDNAAGGDSSFSGLGAASGKAGDVESLVRQLLGPHLRTCPWCRSRPSMAETAAVSLKGFASARSGA